jgi:hypothetical protein
MDFDEFPKIARLSREVIVTEKIDGTNAQVWISDDGSEVKAGSRTRWITPTDDNFGFAAWVEAHRDELLALGPGRHFGEWWGAGIQRKYGLSEKRFSLFNVSRWYDTHQDGNYISEPASLIAAPACCHVVPVLYRGMFDTAEVEGCIARLRRCGSLAAPGFMKPEGVVVFHTAGNVGFKKTLERDEVPKVMLAAA